MTHEEKALAIMCDYSNCAQSVLGAFSDELGLSEEQARRVSFCFFSGMRKAEVCGACTGALMALGLKYGQTVKGDLETRQKGAALAEQFLERFKAENGSYICRDILGYDISKPEEAEKARSCGVFKTVCPKMVASAARIVEKMMEEN